MTGGASIALNWELGGAQASSNSFVQSRISNVKLPVELAARREGDPPELVADNTRAKAALQWKPAYGLEGIVKSAWNWHCRM